jgi:hypothetical protein
MKRRFTHASELFECSLCGKILPKHFFERHFFSSGRCKKNRKAAQEISDNITHTMILPGINIVTPHTYLLPGINVPIRAPSGSDVLQRYGGDTLFL